MILLSLKRGKWVYESSKHIFTVVLVYQYNHKPIHRKYTEVKQGRLKVFPVPLGNFYQTFAIIMRLFHLLKGRLDIIIIPVLLICISTICRIKVTEPLKSTNILLVGQLETPTDPRRWPKWCKGQLRKLVSIKIWLLMSCITIKSVF